MEDYQLHTMPNGIRVVHKQLTHTQIAHVGIMLDIGSRDEQPHQQGLAHFWEHMAFKGTDRRSNLQIINRLENVGGELNAYTTKEKICFHASVLTEHFDKALDLLADITFHSVFPEKQIERERNVILEEISMYYDSPEDAIQDDFDGLIFEGHQLGANILGDAESLKRYKKEDFQTFIAQNLDTEKIVVSSVSKLPFKKVVDLAERLLKDIPASKTNRVRQAPTFYRPQTQEMSRNMTQAQIAVGRQSYALNDEKRLPFFVLVNLLGGPGMNSRLNLSVREKYGLVYGIDAQYTPFTDTGYFGIYFGTEPRQLNKTFSLIHKELKILREKQLTSHQLHVTKQQLMGQLAMSEEGNMSYMLMMAKSLLDMNRIESLEHLFGHIKAITSQQLWDLANEMFTIDQFSYLSFLPEN
ncbi:peptidase M16 [Siphonobacter sp. BAB-5385]|uniref:M16 family metallopeptidase n=1 Tax=unclassified Siphonobacter TaxID=2635712 RepID=UPI000B9E50F9|nr:MULTISPECIES: pitrilysin family protein [unclassified Siphonobacter]OZI09865.1 peptidase M16 [Siphonobacter sp. BAB-5385]PMD97655.1 peptidase M16 [Siphonobacter sp. BAB-5405]